MSSMALQHKGGERGKDSTIKGSDFLHYDASLLVKIDMFVL